MSTLHVVLIGCSATEDSLGQTPEPEDVERAVKIAEERGYQVVVNIVDPLYIRTLRKIDYPSHVIGDNMETDMPRLKSLGAMKSVVIVPEEYEVWEPSFRETDQVVYINYLEDLDRYEIMGLVESYQTANRWFFSETERISISQLIVDWIGYFEVDGAVSPMSTRVVNFIEGKQMEELHYQSDLNAVKKYLIIGVEAIMEYLSAGFHLGEYMTKKVASWAMNVEVIPLSAIINFYGMYPTMEDRTPHMEMIESANYRRDITDLMITCIGSFIVSNGIFQVPDDISEGGPERSRWYDVSLWETIHQNVKAWVPANAEPDIGLSIYSADRELDVSFLSEVKDQVEEVKVSDLLAGLPFAVAEPAGESSAPLSLAGLGDAPLSGPQFEEVPFPFPELLSSDIDKLQSLIPFGGMVRMANPDVTLKEYPVARIGQPDGGFMITVVDESDIVGGTYLRYISKEMLYHARGEVVTAVDKYSPQALAFAYAGFLSGLKVTLFVAANEKDRLPFIDGAKILGAKVIYVGRKGGKGIYSKIRAYRLENPSGRSVFNPKYTSKRSAALLADEIKTRWGEKNQPARLWMVYSNGSEVILRGLLTTFPKTEFMVIQNGSTVPEDLQSERVTLFAEDRPSGDVPKGLNTYRLQDAKIWSWSDEFKLGDVIWNSSGEPLSTGEVRRVKTEAQAQFPPYNLQRRELELRTKTLPSPASQLPHVNDMMIDLKSRWPQTGDSVVYTDRMNISDYYNGDERMKCVFNRGVKISPDDFFLQNRIAVINRAYWLNGDFEEAMYILGSKACNTFIPSVMIDEHTRLKLGTEIDVLDPSMGWGDRLIAALAMNVQSYTGFDPNVDLHPGYNKMKEDFPGEVKTQFIPKKFSSTAPELQGRKFDWVFTSPPFYNLEIYAHTEGDTAKSYQQWLTDIYHPYLTSITQVMKPGGYADLYVQDVDEFKLAEETVKIMTQNGAPFVKKINIQYQFKDVNGYSELGRPRDLYRFRLEG